MFHNSVTPARFSLLLLEEGECYLGDHEGLHQQVADEGKRDTQLAGGTVRVGSHSITFDPDDEALPIIRIRYENIERVDAIREDSDEESDEDSNKTGLQSVGIRSAGAAVDVVDEKEPIPEEYNLLPEEMGQDRDSATKTVDESAATPQAEHDSNTNAREAETTGNDGKVRKRRGFGKGISKGFAGTGGMMKKGIGSGLGSASSLARKGLDSTVGVAADKAMMAADIAKGGAIGAAGAAADRAKMAKELAKDTAQTARDKASDISGVGRLDEKTGVTKGFGAGFGAAKAAAMKAKSAAALAADKTGVSAVAEKSGLTAMAERAGDFAKLSTLTEGLSTVTDMASGMAGSAMSMAEGSLSDGFSGLTSIKTGLAERLGLKEELGNIIGICVNCTQTMSMRANREIAPYMVEKTKVTHKFLIRGCEERFLEQVQSLVRISATNGGRFSWQNNEVIRKMVDAKIAEITFDAIKLVAEGEKQLFVSQATRITPLVSNAGRVVITDSRLYFQSFFNADCQKSEIESWPVIGDKGITKVERRRYQLRKVAAEVSFRNSESVLMAFENPEAREEFVKFVCSASGCEDDLDTFAERMNEALQAWHAGEMSNYDYLMHLNARAGRTVNDLMQYPVMPWVLKDYVSQNLDLSSSASYRDLSKPMGALQPERLQNLLERYEQMPEDPTLPKFMYGSHYSTPGFVLFYMLRLAPEYMLRLQSGKFDQPDRLFHSIENTWTGVMENASDVKELTPEFYNATFADFLVNRQGINFGETQNGSKIDHVELPPWAGGKATTFVEKMREALESNYVSDHLHEWIDLIFGFKQRGKAAEEAANVFYYLTYEGAVDLDEVDDPMEIDSILAQISEFGQTPSQLFQTAHPPKGERSSMPSLCDLRTTPAPP